MTQEKKVKWIGLKGLELTETTCNRTTIEEQNRKKPLTYLTNDQAYQVGQGKWGRGNPSDAMEPP